MPRRDCIAMAERYANQTRCGQGAERDRRALGVVVGMPTDQVGVTHDPGESPWYHSLRAGGQGRREAPPLII